MKTKSANPTLRQLLRPIRRLTVIALVTLGASAAMAQAQARIAVVGDWNWLLIGQMGYCGDMTRIGKEAALKILVDGGARTWIRPDVDTGPRSHCQGDFSFVPEPGNKYVVRFTADQQRCEIELFRLVAAGDPEREPLQSEERRSCLFQ